MNYSKSDISRKVEAILKQADRPVTRAELFAKVREGIDPAQAVRVYMQRSGDYHLAKNGEIPISVTEQIEIGRERMFYAAIRNKVAGGKIIKVKIGEEDAYTLPDSISNWTDVLLERTGDAPIQFYGKQIATSAGSPEDKRWHEIRIWETRSRKYVLNISYLSTWQGESLQLCNHVVTMDDLSKVVEELHKYNPTQYVRGYPNGEKYEDKQKRLLQTISDHYLKLVTEVLRQLPQIVQRID